jgi:CheY-like chemotaxis protein
MNAIIGISELLISDSELPNKTREYVKNIKQASSNLLSIINDLLDFSKIEAGHLDIISAKFMLSSLVNDTVNIIRMRILYKPIRFFTNINSAIPNNLLGDEVRLRQILLNLLGNAVKYTEKGFISLSITEKKPRKGNKLTLSFGISDSGFGIKPEDQEKLFGDFFQVSMKKNRSIEGTGLGLAITKRLCIAMNGDIEVESEYGKGSTFTVTMPLVAESDIPFAIVNEPEKRNVLVYERRKIYAQSLEWSLKSLRIPHKLTFDLDEFKKALHEEEWHFIFSGHGLYDDIKYIMEQPSTEFKDRIKPNLVLMVEWGGTDDYIPQVRFLSLPVHVLSIADVLNGAYDDDNFDQTSSYKGIRITAPDAHILIVDDISINLEVAEALMEPYQIKIDTCLSGAESLKLIQNNIYDIIFMDHMMPEMDGIETTKLIREWEAKQPDTYQQIPIIALTANAVSGMREKFLLHGFNDFIAKPIDISKLDKIMEKWIPPDKQIRSLTYIFLMNL